MNQLQWERLLQVMDGKTASLRPAGFIIDSPWLPGWNNVSSLDYYADGETWFLANRKAVETFPEVIFLPGFWSEFGMCTEPSAFGSKMVWLENDMPWAQHIFTDSAAFSELVKPNVKTDGLLPLTLKRLVHYEPKIQSLGHEIRFAVSRGPLNIASFLIGTTDFMMALSLFPEETTRGLSVITDFIIDWIGMQMETFKSIEGVFILDDIVGFLGKPDFETYALPYLSRIYNSFPARVKFFHNDAHGLVCAPYLEKIGINLFNFSFNHGMEEMRQLAGKSVTLLGNIPPLEVMATGNADEVKRSVKEALHSITDQTRIIWSAGGGMSPGVPTANIWAFLDALKAG